MTPTVAVAGPDIENGNEYLVTIDLARWAASSD